MTYTYRQRPSKTGPIRSFLERAFGVVLVAGFFAIWVVFVVHWWRGSERNGLIALGVLVAFFMACIISLFGWCEEIRLNEDGWCELRKRRRVVRLRVEQIRWVKWIEPDSDNVGQHYLIGFEGGSMRVPDWDDFEDFVERLTRLNPASQTLLNK